MPLFQKSVINKYLKTLDENSVKESFLKFTNFYGDKQRLENIKLLKEENYQEGFLREIFVQVLGYTINPDKDYNLTTEFKNQTDARKADGAILRGGKAIGVIELKSTKTKDLETIKEQAFSYKHHQDNCRYIITSNFEKLRFYIDNATEFEEFNLFNLNENDFKILYLFLSKESIFADIPQKLKEESKLHEENISDKLYQDYSRFKQKIFENLFKNNPQFDKLTLFKKSQKLLDRFLFVLFAEDSGLLPPNAMTKIIEQWKQFQELDEPVSLYSRFVKLFYHLNVGHKYENYELYPYNGGLFEADEILDNAIIDDDVLLQDTLKLSTYNFQTEVDVNILGHIFEHSISEIEELTSELEGKTLDKKKTKRKKEGIFYTPKYITKYIVDNTVGALCEQKKQQLNLKDIDPAILQNSRTSVGKLNRGAKDLLNRLNLYREYLVSLKILDPACGSGAFLNQALEFLIYEHQFIDEQRRTLEQDSLGLHDIERSILENNLYGVDINEESVEIAKLSLWLRTAEKGRKLSNLNNNIKCGNSLIDDESVAGEKAFKWEDEFSEIMKNGGFDVVIGNPPYVQVNEHQEYYSNNYQTSSCGDLYALFIEKGILLLRGNGLFSFITPSLYIKGLRYEPLRNFLLEKIDIIEILDKGDGVFQNVQMPTAILTFVNSNKIIQYWNEFIQGNNIISKLEHNSLNISNFSKIKRGLEIGKDKVYKNGNGVEILTGENISRYFIKDKSLISDETYIKFKKDEYYFSGKRVVIRETGNRLTSIFVNENIQQNRSLYSIKIEDEKISYLFLLSLINSKLIQYYYKAKFAANTDIFPKIRIAQVKDIPIKEISKNHQQPYIEKADQMLELNKQLQEKKYKFFSRIKNNLEIEKISSKLNSFYNNDFKSFLSELKKQKIILSLKQQDEWEEYFNNYKTELLNIQAEINKTDNEIDQMVYKLYNLSDEEIQIIEGNI
ncbi:N-6 DNA methylase [candidate division KSB1 bacterium]|nr:N-6 DNA methylase [candidate division KSB1 bacterium]